MASRYNLTLERKEKLKKEVLEEIDKTDRFKIKPNNKKKEKHLIRLNPQPRSFKIESQKPIIKNETKKEVKPMVLAPKSKPIIKTVIKQEVKPVALQKSIVKIEIKKEVKPTIQVKKSPYVKLLPTKPIAPKKVKAKISKPVHQAIPKPVKVLVASKIKIAKPITPAQSPIPKKIIFRQTPEDRIRERELFFKSNTPVKTTLSFKRIFKPQISFGHKKMFILGVVVCLILALILALAIDILGIYRLAWQDPVSQRVVNILLLPAGTVDGRIIKLSDYYNDLRTFKAVLSSTSTSPPDMQLVGSSQTRDQLFNRLVSVSIVDHELKRYGQSVTDKNINEEMDRVVSQIGSIEKAADDIKSTYGMDISSFKTNVLKPIIALDILSKLITSDENLDINKEAKKNAEDALRIALEPGTDFKTLVLQFANDPSTLNQLGDLGWISRGELPQEIETALFLLKDGEVYSQVVKDNYGYHIYKVESRLTDKDSGQESLKLNQIFIRVNTELYIKSLFDKAVIKRFI